MDVVNDNESYIEVKFGANKLNVTNHQGIIVRLSSIFFLSALFLIYI